MITMNFRKTRSRSRRNSMNFIISTEKWRNYGKRISRRNIEFIDENSEESETKIDELRDWVEEFFTRKSSGSSKSEQDVEVFLTKKQTLILSTLVPDEVLLMDKFDTTHPKRFVGVLLMADVSGYTALTERYNNLGKGGTYRLTVTLNTYLGSLIEVIYSHGGDIIKFAGDAFLALWKTDKRTYICHTIHTVIACALIIQHSYGSYETDVKVNLKVKLAIAAGNLIFSPIGTGIDMNYVIIGLPVSEAKLAESMCISGEVILSPSAWGHCYSRNYDYVIHDDGFVTIKSILYDPCEKDVSKPFAGFATMVRQIKKPLIKNLPDNLSDSNSITNLVEQNETHNFRPTIFVAEEKNIGSEIRKFMIRPVLTQIDAHQPLEYLTEMRQVTVMFITLKPRVCTYPQLITIVNNAYQITCDIVYKSMGCVNKIILFDKDVMILVIFGLRGFKHESEAQAALKCSSSIKKSVSFLDGVLEVSIGITTGQVYCGVVGHPLRREFTVIGTIVNKAARFMCNFRNKITCDEATFVKSRMSSNGFTLQPTTILKGIPRPGKIYEYTEEIRVKQLYDIPMIPPLLDRENEMGYFENWLHCNNVFNRDFDALLIIGETRIGKSRLLEWMARSAKNKELQVCYVSLTTIHSATPYLALSQVTNQLLHLKEPIIEFTKEEAIVKMLKSYNDNLCYLNNILKVRFAYHEGINSQDEHERREKAKQIFTKLIMAVLDVYIIFLDDLQNLDGLSWDFISIMFNSPKIFTILTVTRGKFSSANNWLYSVFANDKIKKIVLHPLTSAWITPLACQILDVDAVPNDLCNALRTKCNGIPGLIESFIVHMFSIGAIEVKKICESELNNWESEDLQFPDSALLHPIAVNASDQMYLDKLVQENFTGEIGICVITEKNELSTDINLQSLDTLIMIQIDSLTPYQQLLLKIASVIGNVLSRDLLESIMYENNPITTAKAIKRLFSMHILACANANYNSQKDRESSTATISTNVSGQANITCECYFEHDSENLYNLPKYAFCKVIKFKSNHSRKTCYELLPINQKREFHSRIVHYLENNKQKCTHCGGTIMIVQSFMSLAIERPFARQYNSSEVNSNSEESNSDDEYETGMADIVGHTSVIKESIDLKKAKSETLNNPNLYNHVTKTSSEVLSHESFLCNKSISQQAPILKKSLDFGTCTNQRSTKRVTMSGFLEKSFSVEFNNCKIYDMLRPVLEAYKLNDWHELGIIDSTEAIVKEQKNKNTRESLHINIEKGISEINMKKCTCAELNIVIHEQLIHHAIEAELKIKAVEFIIRFCFYNVLANNVENVLAKLEEAESICLEKQSNNITDLDKKQFLGQIYSLRAASHFISSNLLAANLDIERALNIYHKEFDNIVNFFKLHGIISSMTSKRKKYRKHNRIMKSHAVFCLNIAALIYCALGEERKHRTATSRALKLVQNVDCNIVDVCNAFSNAIQVEVDRGSILSTIDIEQMAKNTIEKQSKLVHAEDLFALGKMFMAFFRARMSRGDLAAAIRSGYKVIVISRFLAADDVSIDIIPDLFYILLSRCRIAEAVDVLKLSLQLCQTEVSLECETWYYALCMDMILDAGFQLESVHDISRFAEYTLNRGKSAGSSRRRLVVNLWTYWLRADSDHKARRFESEALGWRTREDDDGTTNSLLSAMRLAEGMLESLARKVDDLKKVVDLKELQSLADKELTKLEMDVIASRAVYPRWLLLKATSLRLSRPHSPATSTFNQAIEEARKVNSRLEEALARAATLDSKLWFQSAKTGHFMHWSRAAEHAKSSWHELLYTMTTSRH